MSAPGPKHPPVDPLDHMKLVRVVAKNYSVWWLSRRDLVSIGCLGLTHACARYERERGSRFSSYAWPCIRGAIRAELSHVGWPVRVPWTVYKWARRLRAEGYDRAWFSERRWHRYQYAVRIIETVRAPERDSDPFLLSVADDRQAGIEAAVLDADESRWLVAQALECLDERRRLVVEMRFGLGADGVVYLPAAVAKRLGVTQERIRQLESDALRKMRKRLVQQQCVSWVSRHVETQ